MYSDLSICGKHELKLIRQDHKRFVCNSEHDDNVSKISLQHVHAILTLPKTQKTLSFVLCINRIYMKPLYKCMAVPVTDVFAQISAFKMSFTLVTLLCELSLDIVRDIKRFKSPKSRSMYIVRKLELECN